MRRVLLLILTISIALTSCVKPDDVKIGDIKEINVLSASEVEVTIEVENKSPKNFTLREMKFSIMVGDPGSESELIQAVMPRPVVLPRRFSGELSIPVRIRFENILSSITLNLDGSVLDKVYIVGYAVVKTGLVKEQRVEMRKKIDPKYIKDLAKSEMNIDLDKLEAILDLF